MANYYGFGRTNYVKIKDIDNLQARLAGISVDIEVVERGGLYMFSGFRSDSGVIPEIVLDDNDNEIDVFGIIVSHMEDDQVLVYMEAGSEKARYADGYAFARHSDGRMVFVDLKDIYEKAEREFGLDRGTIGKAAY